MTTYEIQDPATGEPIGDLLFTPEHVLTVDGVELRGRALAEFYLKHEVGVEGAQVVALDE
tara:strand:+ start:39676 stop:39855 length:180 start_codon:yes stop_codon:yes gene_type:complete